MKNFKKIKHIVSAFLKRKSFLIFALFFLLGDTWAILTIADRLVVLETEQNSIVQIPFSVAKPASYPLIQNVLSAQTVTNSFTTMPDITAQAAVVMDDNSKVILFAKNQTLRFSMASTTKIMTALVGLDQFGLSDILTIKTDTVEGSVAGFKKGEKVRFEDLLYALMLPSANDAAVAIADNYPGGEPAFIAKMNEKASTLHLFNTHYTDPAGLDDSGDYTTVVDLARLTSVAMKNNVISHVVGTKKKDITIGNTGRMLLLANLNKLLGIDGVVGVKTGFTDEAGGVLATAKNEGDQRLILVVMKSEDRFLDTQKLLSLLSGKIIYQPILE